MAKLICYDCGKELPTDSKFCQYCGSKNIGKEAEKTILSTKNETDEMICLDCNKTLPADSVFCQYCGSKNITTIKNTKKADASAIDNSIAKASTDDLKKVKNYKTPLIIVCVIACVLAIGWISTYSNQITTQNQLQSEIDSLNSKVKSAENKAKTAETKASNYQKQASDFSSVSSALGNQQVKNGFRTDYYYLKNPSNKKVMLYTYESYGGCTFYPRTTGGVTMKWGDSCYVGSKGCPIYVTNNGASGTLTITNNYDSNKVVIFVEGK